jgi:hypothetical protein
MTERFDPRRFGRKGVRPALTLTPLPKPLPGEKYLAGPIPFRWWSLAARLRGRALHVALVIWHQRRVRREAVRPSRKLLEQCGVKPDSARRAIRDLENAGLIAVVREVGKSPTITILDVAPDDDGAQLHVRCNSDEKSELH